jgi:hypothetical protein
MSGTCLALPASLTLQDRPFRATCAGDPSFYHDKAAGKCCYRCPSGEWGTAGGSRWDLCPQVMAVWGGGEWGQWEPAIIVIIGYRSLRAVPNVAESGD